jgi:glyoxylate reductase
MEIAYAGRRRADPAVEADLGARLLPLAELLAEADIVSLHVPLNDRTHHLIDAAALRRMKPSAYLVNTTRGPVVDEAALVDALGSATIETRTAMAVLAAQNAVAVLAGEPPLTPVA